MGQWSALTGGNTLPLNGEKRKGKGLKKRESEKRNKDSYILEANLRLKKKIKGITIKKGRWLIILS